jgi:uncharacterized protein (DUF1697 family)
MARTHSGRSSARSPGSRAESVRGRGPAVWAGPLGGILAALTRYVGFLRGINVGKAKRLAMADLREACAELGLEDVRTQGQSGNLVFDSKLPARTLESQIGDAIKKRFGMDVVVVVRSAAQLAAVIKRNPFEKVATVPKYSTVSFLSKKPAAKALKALDPADYEPEQFELHGTELYIWMPEGQIKSRLYKELSDAKLGVAATNRNWNTLLKLHEMAAA